MAVTSKRCITVESEGDMAQLAKEFSQSLTSCQSRPYVVFLTGDLGAGKSVFARSLLKAFGVSGSIKSPTYTLAEQYTVPNNAAGISQAAHLDLYRLSDPEELYFIGFDEVLASNQLLLIEWPEKGLGQLPNPTHHVMIEYQLADHQAARKVTLIEA